MDSWYRHGIDIDSWYQHGLMVLTTPMVSTKTHGIVISLARTHGIEKDSWY